MAQDDHGRAVEGELLRRGIECHVGRLDALLLVEEPIERSIDPADHPGKRAEVLGQVEQALAQEPALYLVVDCDVRAAEAVDRLLGVTDDEELALRGLELAPVALLAVA